MDLAKTNFMISVGVCDDEEKLLPYIINKTRTLFIQEGFSPVYQSYASSEAFLKEMGQVKPFDAVFLDISMPQVDGIALARRIQMQWADTYIIFVSAKEELVFHAFKGQPFYFVRKRLFEEDICYAIRQLCAVIKEKNRQDTIVLDVQKEQFQFSIKDMIYVEAADKYLVVVRKQGETLLRYRISELEGYLKPYGFIRIHKSYLVNCRYVFLIKDRYVVLDDGKQLPLSRHRLKQVRQEFREFIQ